MRRWFTHPNCSAQRVRIGHHLITHVTVIGNVVDAVPAGPVYDAVAVYGPTCVIGLNCGDVHLPAIPLESVCVAVYV